MATLPAMPIIDKLYFGRDKAAQLADVSTRTIDDAIRAGDLPAYRIGRRVLIRREDLVAFAERVTAR